MSDDLHKIYLGLKYTRRKDGYYIRRHWDKTNKKYIVFLAHREIWKSVNGEIPDRVDIHHIDGNPSNNVIENLALCARSEHLKEHWRVDNEKRRAQLDKVRPLDWLKSEEGRKAVSEKGKEVWKNRQKKIIKCEHCGIEKAFKRWARFCTKTCYMKWRHKQGLCK